ncbi:MAG: hypothetical protein M3329_06855 [Pseudomonadota bacterium]|nr:hypothetical protein [Pseudomonadota bacterium]
MTTKDKESGSLLRVINAGHTSSHALGVLSSSTIGQVSAIAKALAAKLTKS